MYIYIYNVCVRCQLPATTRLALQNLTTKHSTIKCKWAYSFPPFYFKKKHASRIACPAAFNGIAAEGSWTLLWMGALGKKFHQGTHFPCGKILKMWLVLEGFPFFWGWWILHHGKSVFCWPAVAGLNGKRWGSLTLVVLDTHGWVIWMLKFWKVSTPPLFHSATV